MNLRTRSFSFDEVLRLMEVFSDDLDQPDTMTLSQFHDIAGGDHTTTAGKSGSLTRLTGRDGTMKTICLNQLSWRSYITLCTMISVCIGFALSILLVLLVYVAHVSFSIHIGTFYIGGGLFSIVSVFIGPFVGGAVGFLGSLFTHPLFTMLLVWLPGVPLTGKWMDSEHHEAIG